jgi:type IV pilus assembly protein PilY1
VLVFGGGWDPDLDVATVYAPPVGDAFLGNAIYIVDPTNGNLIMSISGTTGSNIVVPEMVYSIPSRIRLIDSNADGLTDRLYVGDTGGQIFRVDLDPNIEPSSTTAPEADTVVGLLASISDPAMGMESQRRRFFEPPSVVQVRDEIYSDIQEYDYVLIGTGYRAHPLDLTVQDRFYAFRDYYLSPLGDDDGDNLAESTDNYPVSDGAFTNADLIDVTANPLVSTEAAVRGAAGWYYDFTSAGAEGEKVLSAATTTAGIVTFTTFRPGAALSNDPCASGVGNAFAYNFDILSADAALDWDGDGDIDSSDRSLALGSGIPSGVVPIFTREGVVGIVGIEGGAAQLGVLAGLPRFRTYWYEES